ncbi:MAG: GDP-mannose 4,6-dehydratase [Akkermansiaceae bacterium]|jgi:UDP-glucuronate 4-epimerase
MIFPFRNVLLTGGAGFIGSHMAEKLLSAGCEVTVLDDFNDFYDPSIKEANLQAVGEKLDIRRIDVRHAEAVNGLFHEKKFDCVIHLAARAGVRPSIQDPQLYLSTNVDGTLHLLEACRQHDVRHFIFASSSSVYGVNSKVPFAEADLIERTISPYAATKLMGEQLCSNYSYLYGIRCMCLRFFTVYGPRQRPDLAIAKFTRRILDGVPIEQYGDGSTARDYTYIEDIVQGIIGAAIYEKSNYEIFNLGGSETHTLSELITTIESAVGKKAIIRKLSDQPGDVPRTFADITKARKLIGYSPSTSFSSGVRRYVDWIKTSTSGGL